MGFVILGKRPVLPKMRIWCIIKIDSESKLDGANAPPDDKLNISVGHSSQNETEGVLYPENH